MIEKSFGLLFYLKQSKNQKGETRYVSNQALLLKDNQTVVAHQAFVVEAARLNPKNSYKAQATLRDSSMSENVIQELNSGDRIIVLAEMYFIIRQNLQN